MAKEKIKSNEGYWTSGSELDDEDVQPNYYYIATNNPPVRSIIQQVKSLITDINFDSFVFEPYLTLMQLDVIVI